MFILSLHIILRRVSIVVETTWRINRLDTPVDVRKVTFLTKMFKTVSTFFQTLIFFIAFSSRPILMHVSCLKIHWSTQENKWRQSCFIVYFNLRVWVFRKKIIFFVYLVLVAREFFSPRVQSVILEHADDVVTCFLFGDRVDVITSCVLEVVQYWAQRLGLSIGFHWRWYCQTGWNRKQVFPNNEADKT